MAEAAPKGGKGALTTRSQSIARRAGVLSPWFVTLWLAAMTGWYVKTAVRALRHPINEGNQMQLAMVWLILAAAVVLSHFLFRRRIVTFIWTLGVTAVGLLMIVLSRQSVSALITIWLLALAWTYGDWLLRLMGARPSSRTVEWVCLACTIGFVLLSMAGLSLLLMHCMSARWIWIMLLTLTAVRWRSFLAWFERLRQKARTRPVSTSDDTFPEQGVLLVLLGVIVLFNLAWALAPEIMYDGLSYHLAVPKAYLAERGLVNLPYGYNAHLAETIFTVALGLHGQIVAKLLMLAMSVISALGVYALGRNFCSPRVGLWAATLFYSTPLVSWLSCNTYNDLLVALFLLAVLLAFLRWRETRQVVWLLATGFLGGAALGTKLTALFALPVIGFLVVMDVLRAPELSARSKVRALTCSAFAAFLVAAPYFIIVYTFTGNPFFPLLNGLFIAGSLDPAQNLNVDLARFSLGFSPLVFLKLPFAFTFESQRFGEGLPAGGLGIAYALLPLGLLFLIVRRKGALVLLAMGAVFLALLSYTMPYGRYYIPILPVVQVLAIAAVLSISSKGWLTRFNLAFLGAGLVAQVAVIPLTYWNIPERVPVSLVLGRETQEAFLTRALPLYRAVLYINRNSLPGQKILSLFGQHVRFYAKNPMVEVHFFSDYLRGTTMQETAARLAQDGFAFLLAPRGARETRRGRLFRPPPYLREPFLAQYADLEYAAGNMHVYRLRERAAGSALERNRLTNPSFELKNAAGLPADWDVYGRPPRVVEDAARAHSGQVSMLVDSSGGLVSLVPVQGERVYSLGHWARAELPEQDGRVQINWLDANENIVDVTISVFRATTKWTWHQASASAPPKASLAQVYLSVHENSEVFFDDYVFVQGQLQVPQ